MLLDVDGVLTDGTVIMHADGTESKEFHIRDGAGDRLGAAGRASRSGCCRRATSAATTAARGAARDHDRVAGRRRQARPGTSGSSPSSGLDDEQVAYMGDDLLESPCSGAPASPAAPADAAAGSAGRGALGQRARRRTRRGARVHRARAARAGALGRDRRGYLAPDGTADHASSVLVALLVGLAVGKAWERYKLQRRALDRPAARARVAALHARPQFPGRQPDRSGDRRAVARPRRPPATRSRST